MDSQGDLRLHWRANGDGGKAEKSYMGPILTPGGEAEQVQTLQLTTSKQLFHIVDNKNMQKSNLKFTQ